MMTLSVTGVIDAGIAAAAAVGAGAAGAAATEVAAGDEGACVAAAAAPTLVSSSSPSLEQAATNTKVMAKTIDQTMNFNANRFGMSSSRLYYSMSSSVYYAENAP
jgi:hypothetical protein